MGERRIAIMQPYFFPYIGYWQLMAMADLFVVYDDGLFRKKGWIHRNRILGYGPPKLIGTQVLDMSCNRKINETVRIYDPIYVAKTLRGLEYRYRRAPHYAEVMEVIRPHIDNRETNLVRYLLGGLEAVRTYLGIETPLVLSSTVDKAGADGAVAKAGRICEKFGIRNYVNPIGGAELYTREEFARYGMDLSFIRRNDDIAYVQFEDAFVPDLSIIDVMMFNSVPEIRDLLKRYTLV